MYSAPPRPSIFLDYKYNLNFLNMLWKMHNDNFSRKYIQWVK